MKLYELVALFVCVNLSVIQGYDFYDSIDNNLDNEQNRRILYGQPADETNFRFIIHLKLDNGLCAGSIIGSNWVITAAHCTAFCPCQNIKMFVTIWRSPDGIQPSECYIHPKYRYEKTDSRYDISLLRSRIDLLKDGRARAIPLPPPGTKYSGGEIAVIAGWGKTEIVALPDRLLAAKVRVEHWDRCNSKFRINVCGSDTECPPQVQMPNRAMCTQGDQPSPSGTCHGDSGGPVMVNGFLAGIGSFAFVRSSVCVLGSPSMHVNVADYLPWIYSIIDPNLDTRQMPAREEY